MAGRRRKPCEYCEIEIYSDEDKNVDGPNGFYMWYEWYPLNNGLLSVMAQANDAEGYMMEGSIDFNFNYCPMCGRKLPED